jgi:hypothetical protein
MISRISSVFSNGPRPNFKLLAQAQGNSQDESGHFQSLMVQLELKDASQAPGVTGELDIPFAGDCLTS